MFYDKYPMSPGEYAYFKKNFERGINPPYSGSFNNDFYSEGMGCCIRGELWGCLFPFDSTTAAAYAEIDGCIDHSAESVIAAKFISSVISECFSGSDIPSIVIKCAERLPESRFKRMALDVIGWCGSVDCHFEILDKIIAGYGHPDCTNVFQNNGIIIVCLLKYSDDFALMCEKAISCGFDTDCTVGICASVYGTANGAAAFSRIFGIDDVALVLGADCPDYGKSVKNFAAEVAKYGVYFSGLDGKGRIKNSPAFSYGFTRETMFSLEEYEPVMLPGQSQTVKIRLSGRGFAVPRSLKLSVPEGFGGRIGAQEGGVVSVECVMLDNLEYRDKNVFTLYADGGEYNFGFYAPQTLYVSKPYFENFYDIELEKYSSYLDYFGPLPDRDDALRRYHISYDTDFDKQYLDMARLSVGEFAGFSKVYNIGDRIDAVGLTGYTGPCVLYIVKELYSDEDKFARMLIGTSDCVEVYLNGEKLLLSKSRGFFTYERFHLPEVRLKKGRNVFAYKILRANKHAEYSAIITEQGECMAFPKHMLGFMQRTDSEVRPEKINQQKGVEDYGTLDQESGGAVVCAADVFRGGVRRAGRG